MVVRMVKEGGDKRDQGLQGCCLGDQGLVLWRSLYHQRGAVIGYID